MKPYISNLSSKLLGGWLGSITDEECDKLQKALGRRMSSLNQRFLNVTSH